MIEEPKKKVAYIGNFEPEYSTENDVRKAFEALDWEVVMLQENTMGQNKGMEVDIDLLLITSTWDDALNLNSWLTLVKDCAMRGIPTATIHLDTFWGTSRGGRKWWLNPMFHTAYIFTADGDYQERWKLYGKNHIWLPPGVRHDAAHLGTFRPEYACDVAFVGSNGVGYHEDVWNYRKELVDQIRDKCKKNGWSFKNPGGDDPKIDRNDDMNDFYASAKVTIGDSLCIKREKSEYWSDRVPEATGRGGFLIMPKIDAVTEIYGDSVPTYKWHNFEDLEDKIRTWLADDEGRKQCQAKAQEITAKGHTYINRVKTMLEVMGL